ncbi:hypothetical protein EG329_000452 [Mollisiaceae sp. DMI_Dod_QoI]|nr:hypothetical protein EG329_000452 [Helotiales sp. DMI_Dod_QoI]
MSPTTEIDENITTMPSQMTDVVASALPNGQPQSVILDKFTLFPKLPLELRLIIWALVAPAPAIIIQRKSTVKGRRFHFSRAVPTVLHVCRESRMEYLETGSSDETLERRRAAHPLYKLYFRNRSKKSAGVYMDMDIDSFWGKHYRCSPQFLRTFGHSETLKHIQYTGIFELSLKTTRTGMPLKHLVLSYELFKPLNVYDLAVLTCALPCLEKLTILVTEKDIKSISGGQGPTTYNPEIDEQLDDSGMSSRCTRLVALVRNDARKLDVLKDIFPDRKHPVRKIRFERQFVEMEDLTIPKLPLDALASSAS